MLSNPGTHFMLFKDELELTKIGPVAALRTCLPQAGGQLRQSGVGTKPVMQPQTLPEANAVKT
eukprot:356497-Chlamydomonas_euryale.AAC.2